jgi:hypothetical protein
MKGKLVKLKDGYNLFIDQPLGRLLEATCSISELKRLEENNVSIKKLSLKNCEAIEKEYEDFLSWDMDVEVVMDPTPLTFMGRNLGRNLGILPGFKPKLDADGCLILRHK